MICRLVLSYTQSSGQTVTSNSATVTVCAGLRLRVHACAKMNFTDKVYSLTAHVLTKESLHRLNN